MHAAQAISFVPHGLREVAGTPILSSCITLTSLSVSHTEGLSPEGRKQPYTWTFQSQGWSDQKKPRWSTPFSAATIESLGEAMWGKLPVRPGEPSS